MYLVAIAWMFVVVLMAVTEAVSSVGTVLGAFFTLVLYGVLPLSIVMYIFGAPRRHRLRAMREAEASKVAVAEASKPQSSDASN